MIIKQYLKELQFRVSWTLELMRRRGIKPEWTGIKKKEV